MSKPDDTTIKLNKPAKLGFIMCVEDSTLESILAGLEAVAKEIKEAINSGKVRPKDKAQTIGFVAADSDKGKFIFNLSAKNGKNFSMGEIISIDQEEQVFIDKATPLEVLEFRKKIGR